MDESLPGLKLFRFSPAEARLLRSEFAFVLSTADFGDTDQLRLRLSKYSKTSGIYFWVMKHESVEYKIYIGQTRSLSTRVLNYISPFQPHSPNDHKLQLFGSFINELLPSATFDLYFSRQDTVGLTKLESDANKKYKPLFYRLPTPSLEAKNELKKAFGSYYKTAFNSRLGRL